MPAPPSFRKCGSRIDSSWWASGYSIGHVSSFHRPCGWTGLGGTGMNLFQPFGLVPPSVPTEPVSTFEEPQAAGHLPAALVAGAGRPPVVRGEPSQAPADDVADLADLRRRRCRRLCAAYSGVYSAYRSSSAGPTMSNSHGRSGRISREERLPVDPAAHELAVPRARLEQQPGDGEQQRRLGARPGRQPVVAHRRGVRQAGVDADHLRAALLALHDPLRVGVEVVAGLEVGRDEEDHARRWRGRATGGRSPSRPRSRPGPPTSRCWCGCCGASMPHACEHALHVAVVARPADVVHDLVAAPLADRGADAAADLGERLVPRDPLPLAPAPPARRASAGRGSARGRTPGSGWPGPWRSCGRGWPGGAGLPSSLAISPGVVVDVGEQAAAGLAVEARRGDERVVARVAPAVRPRLGVVLGPVVPAVGRRDRLGQVLGAVMTAAPPARRARTRPRTRTCPARPRDHAAATADGRAGAVAERGRRTASASGTTIPTADPDAPRTRRRASPAGHRPRGPARRGACRGERELDGQSGRAGRRRRRAAPTAGRGDVLGRHRTGRPATSSAPAPAATAWASRSGAAAASATGRGPRTARTGTPCSPRSPRRAARPAAPRPAPARGGRAARRRATPRQRRRRRAG